MDNFDILLIAIGIIMIGIKRMRSRSQKIESLCILPILFMYFLWRTIGGHYLHLVFTWPVAVCGVLIGSLAGFAARSHIKIQIEKKGHVVIPGGLDNVILFIIIVALQFIGHTYIETLHLHNSASLLSYFLLLIIGIGSGITVGQNLCYFYKYTTSLNHNESNGVLK